MFIHKFSYLVFVACLFIGPIVSVPVVVSPEIGVWAKLSFSLIVTAIFTAVGYYLALSYEWQLAMVKTREVLEEADL